MPDKKISQLEEKTILESNDEFPFIRNENGAYVNYKVKRSNIVTTIPDATSSVLGSIRLTGDLGGTALTPTVPELISKANLSSPTFIGNPKAPTPATGDNSTKIATTAFVNTAINNSTTSLNNAKTNVSQQFTGFQGNVRVAQNISGAVSINASLANIYDLTLTGNVTSFTLTNLQSGYYTFNFIQGDTPYTFDWDTNIFKSKDGETTIITNTANKKFKVRGDSNGTVIEYEIGVYSI